MSEKDSNTNDDIANGPYIKSDPQHLSTKWEDRINFLFEHYAVKGVAMLTFFFFLKTAINVLIYHLFEPLRGLLLISVSLFVFVLSQYSFYKSVTTPPGDGSDPNPSCSEDEKEKAKERSIYAVENNMKCVDMGYPVRYCYHCEKFRKSRAYHCSICHQCVDEKDHHCVWLACCVGKKNLKFFVLFLFYTALALLCNTALLAWSLYYDIAIYFFFLSHNQINIFFFLSFGIDLTLLVFSLCFLLALSALLYGTMGQISANETGMEGVEKERYEQLEANKTKLPEFTPKGWLRVKEVLGSGVEMFWPIVRDPTKKSD
ncbi:palmitoyltransferase PFA3, putative [Entamoeba invadens IP1]|uniref:Palmitoyltransferase n=1 Tax=Entamoeba invadens IP1 TaxID=370355 RepID=A0A0A1TU41_ENTIV|nr:palmitoyltransferase PFA3, putative [Entamoeba invadens IP1]ELP83414.1 palmitoyltransferase PFA3, putative [Entamoeba invadens IP1]|eukprot:XP_004182760.1 palmitoyltransferase PFA3, putative [Entamoeba invadens IP1]